MSKREWQPDADRVAEHARAFLAGECSRQGVACLGVSEIAAAIHYATILETELMRAAALPILAAWHALDPKHASPVEFVEWQAGPGASRSLLEFILLEIANAGEGKP